MQYFINNPFAVMPVYIRKVIAIPWSPRNSIGLPGWLSILIYLEPELLFGHKSSQMRRYPSGPFFARYGWTASSTVALGIPFDGLFGNDVISPYGVIDPVLFEVFPMLLRPWISSTVKKLSDRILIPLRKNDVSFEGMKKIFSTLLYMDMLLRQAFCVGWEM